MDLDHIAGTAQTIGKISPPVLLILVINAVALALHKIIPRKFELLLCVIAGMVLYPLLIDSSSLIFAFPDPTAALVCYGILAGFVAKLIQPKVKGILKKIFGIEFNGHNADTQHLTKSGDCPYSVEQLSKPNSKPDQTPPNTP